MLEQEQQAQLRQIMAMKGAPDGPPGVSGGPSTGAPTDAVIAQTAQPDVIGGGSLSLRSRNHVPQGQ